MMLLMMTLLLQKAMRLVDYYRLTVISTYPDNEASHPSNRKKTRQEHERVERSDKSQIIQVSAVQFPATLLKQHYSTRTSNAHRPHGASTVKADFQLVGGRTEIRKGFTNLH